jgi:hypothetical protein
VKDRPRSVVGASVIENIERWGTYLVLGVLIIGGLLSEIFPSLENLIDTRLALVLLASVLFIIFRLIDRSFQDLRPEVESVDFTGAMTRMSGVSNGSVSVNIFANDGTKYYALLGDTNLKVESLRVLLYSPHESSKWQRFEEQGLARAVEVKHCDVKPTLHYMTVGGSGAMVGLFFREGEKVSTGQSFVVSAGSVSGRDLVEAINAHFEREWRLAQPAWPDDETSRDVDEDSDR